MFVFQMRLSFLLPQQCSINVLLTLIYWSWNSTAQWMLMSFKQMEKTYECLPSSSLGQLHQVAGERLLVGYKWVASVLSREIAPQPCIYWHRKISLQLSILQPPTRGKNCCGLLWLHISLTGFYNQIFYPHRKWISTVKCNNKLKKYTWD